MNTFCGPLRTSRALMNFWGIWGHFEDQLRTWGLKTLGTFCAFSWILWTFWTLWGILEDLRTWFYQNVEESFRNFWWLLVNLLRTWCLWGFQWLFRTLRILRTWLPTEDFEDVDNILRNWGRLEYLLWTSEDFEGFDELLRNLRTFWGSVENLRSEDLGYLLCIFLNFVDFLDPLRNFGRPEDLILSERWRIFQELLMTSCEPIEDLMPLRISMTFQDIEDFANLITYWGLWGRW